MGKQVLLTANDGFEFDAYLAEPTVDCKGAVLVIQEIFGVNQHIREVCDGYARHGYAALAPAIFDRAEKHVELGYKPEDIARGAAIARGKLDLKLTMKDLQAGINYLQQFGDVAVVGYCFGGMLTWLCAGQAQGIRCASGYYGGGITQALDVTPKVPTILHFGDMDAHIPLAEVNKIKAAQPRVQTHIYAADHGFNCDHRASYSEAAANQALQRTLDLLAENIRPSHSGAGV
ncbi:dienelactone hydrolase family protein [Pseudomonadales bacterium]|nr:dienelactone hydrolase family protein [Pseudomonadales bacterium]